MSDPAGQLHKTMMVHGNFRGLNKLLTLAVVWGDSDMILAVTENVICIETVLLNCFRCQVPIFLMHLEWRWRGCADLGSVRVCVCQTNWFHASYCLWIPGIHGIMTQIVVIHTLAVSNSWNNIWVQCVFIVLAALCANSISWVLDFNFITTAFGLHILLYVFPPEPVLVLSVDRSPTIKDWMCPRGLTFILTLA